MSYRSYSGVSIDVDPSAASVQDDGCIRGQLPSLGQSFVNVFAGRLASDVRLKFNRRAMLVALGDSAMKDFDGRSAAIEALIPKIVPVVAQELFCQKIKPHELVHQIRVSLRMIANIEL